MKFLFILALAVTTHAIGIVPYVACEACNNNVDYGGSEYVYSSLLC